MEKKPLPLSSHCAMTCAEGAFHRFLSGHFKVRIDGKDDAARFVRNYCGILSRSALNNDEAAASLWRGLRTDYEAWLMS